MNKRIIVVITGIVGLFIVSIVVFFLFQQKKISIEEPKIKLPSPTQIQNIPEDNFQTELEESTTNQTVVELQDGQEVQIEYPEFMSTPEAGLIEKLLEK